MGTVKNTNKEYHSGEGVSKSDLDLLHTCPAKYRYRKDNPDDNETPAMLFGSMVHKLILEPEDFEREYAVAPECDRRTKAGKAIFDEFAAKVNAVLGAQSGIDGPIPTTAATAANGGAVQDGTAPLDASR